jgi:multisubunit Na+/H+ antiporter MnhC subunit
MPTFLGVLGSVGVLMSLGGGVYTFGGARNVIQEIAGLLLLGQGLVLTALGFGLGGVLEALRAGRASSPPQVAPASAVPERREPRI